MFAPSASQASSSEKPIHLLPTDLPSFVWFFPPTHERDFRNIATLQLDEEISCVHRASAGVLVGSKHFLDKRLEARVVAN
jgi:hypothetical protein